jgi:hypothetical protein
MTVAAAVLERKTDEERANPHVTGEPRPNEDSLDYALRQYRYFLLKAISLMLSQVCATPLSASLSPLGVTLPFCSCRCSTYAWLLFCATGSTRDGRYSRSVSQSCYVS